MNSLYVLQTSEQDLATGGLEFTCCFEAEKAYFEAYFKSPKGGGFASLVQVDPSNKNASGYSQKTIRQYQTGIYNNR
tara:strand:- start:267 stop:497 length:231 start_codon:yes stop_codon:yes gene_type:complete